MIKKYFGIILIILFTLSCNLGQNNNEDSKSDSFVAEEVADSVANEESGATAELLELSNLLIEDPKENKSTIYISANLGVLNAEFEWNNDEKQYEYISEGSIDVSVDTAYIGGVITDCKVTLKFFTSTDASGEGVQLTDMTIDESIHSLKYSRIYDAKITNSYRNIERNLQMTTDITITGINDETEGIIINGSRTENINVDTGYRTGSWSISYNFNSIEINKKIDEDTIYTTYKGSISINFNGTYTGLLGQITINKDATLFFDRSRKVTISIDDNTVIVDITSTSN